MAQLKSSAVTTSPIVSDLIFRFHFKMATNADYLLLSEQRSTHPFVLACEPCSSYSHSLSVVFKVFLCYSNGFPLPHFPLIFRFRHVKMRTTRSHINKAGDDASGSTGTL